MMNPTTPQYVEARQLKRWIHDGAELALLDVREHGQYGEDHLFFATPLPYSGLELAVLRLVPRKATRVVVYGDEATEGAVRSSADALLRLGYSNVHILRGGIEAWKAAGHATFAGVNLPSKTFGELAEHAYKTPSVSASELYGMLNDGSSKVVVLDGRPIPEYRKMNIPGSYCCPNGELALRAQELAPDPDTTIVVNCAGRTRSIIGAQTLIHLDVPNKVYALENGTQGWFLEDLPLEHGSSRLYPDHVAESAQAGLRERAARLASRFKIGAVDAGQVREWLRDDARTVFLCDVRTEEEFNAGGLPSLVQHAPGGQLIQATDQYLGVRGARVVLCDLDGIRAPVVASWLKQLGWDVCLLKNPEALGELPQAPSYAPDLGHTTILSADHLAEYVRSHPQALVLDARPSSQYRALSLRDSAWVIRPALATHVDDAASGPVLILGAGLAALSLLARDLEEAGCRSVALCVVDAAGLKASGLPLVADGDRLPDSACIDYLFFVHDRHDGNKEAARKYLEWETNLVAQLDEQERNTFSIGI
ncbi:rhodanese-like domain-containing protein [uncultured Castellaniella sp.]|uniref:rhodanese-like domain-containing protein n=1 Tax=uncultured Castellaniella sp. TaxID=647907 RepID=UPI002617ED7A|nr:rhodanese-like domain-containing protein [uncultured Castellaniella sp.]